jgi:hypothetical protein
MICLRYSPTDLPDICREVPQLHNSEDFSTTINPERTIDAAEHFHLKDQEYKREMYERVLQPITGMTYDADCASIEYVYYGGELSETDGDDDDDMDTVVTEEQQKHKNQKREIYQRVLQPITGMTFESDSAANEFVYYTGESSEDEKEEE